MLIYILAIVLIAYLNAFLQNPEELYLKEQNECNITIVI